MNTQVKVGIAAAIVAALVALIVLDQKTTPKDDAPPKTSGGDPAMILGTNSGAESPSPRISDEETNQIYKAAQQKFGDPSQKSTTSTPVKGSEEKNEKRVSPSSTGEEYVIKEGDTLDKIAEKTMGSKSYASKIADANPGLKPTALRPGKKLLIPAKAEKPVPAVEKADEPQIAKETTPLPAPAEGKTTAAPKQDISIQTVNGQKIYTVQPGDTLSGISVKVYNTSRHYQKIYEANKEAIEDPNTLQVGLKLTMPDLPSKVATPNLGAPGTGTAATSLPPLTPPAPVASPTGSKVVQVAPGDRLWTIAAKLASERKIGILDMIKIIVDANIDKKLREDGSNLQAGWQLIIPE
ncbi:MAG TPA: LysM peptidoglycan-binding domain-containing protein [Planctomycetota bacterium]|nr:LysM peptidoglycan-binding domain-containing protein [Planctomycetota bacterium]